MRIVVVVIVLVVAVSAAAWFFQSRLIYLPYGMAGTPAEAALAGAKERRLVPLDPLAELSTREGSAHEPA